MTGVYKITNQINKKVYIGQSIDVVKRLKVHAGKYYENRHFMRAIEKYGIENFQQEIIVECEPGLLSEYEKKYILEYRSNESQFGYNKTPGGQKGNSSPRSEETRRKISLAHRGKILTEEHKLKISQSLMGKASIWMKGRKASEETRRKMSQKRTGMKCPKNEEYRRKISNTLKGRHPSEESRKKMSESKKAYFAARKVE